MKTETVGRLYGDAADALSWLGEAWQKQKKGASEADTRHQMVEAGERFESVARQIGIDLGWQRVSKRRGDKK